MTNNIHIVTNKKAKPRMCFVEHLLGKGDYEIIQVPESELPEYLNKENYYVPCCTQGACRERNVVVLDSYYPYMWDHNHCRHCAEVLLDMVFDPEVKGDE